MKATVEVELHPFSIPNFVRQIVPAVSGGNSDTAPPIPLTALDSYTLHQLCEDFRRSVFEKAGKEQPPTQAPRCSKCKSYV